MLAYYKPAMSGGGHAFSFKLLAIEDKKKKTQELIFLMEAVKQTGAAGKPGTFKGGKQIAVKLNVIELGTIIDGIETNFAAKVSLFHKFDGNSTQIAFYKLNKKKDDDPDKFAVNINRGEAKFGCALTRGELTTLREYLKWAMRKMFEAAAKAQKAKIKKPDEA